MIDNASDNTTLAAVLAGYEDSGFDESFSPMDDKTVKCLSCGSTLAS